MREFRLKAKKVIHKSRRSNYAAFSFATFKIITLISGAGINGTIE